MKVLKDFTARIIRQAGILSMTFLMVACPNFDDPLEIQEPSNVNDAPKYLSSVKFGGDSPRTNNYIYHSDGSIKKINQHYNFYDHRINGYQNYNLYVNFYYNDNGELFRLKTDWSEIVVSGPMQYYEYKYMPGYTTMYYYNGKVKREHRYNNEKVTGNIIDGTGSISYDCYYSYASGDFTYYYYETFIRDFVEGNLVFYYLKDSLFSKINNKYSEPKVNEYLFHYQYDNNPNPYLLAGNTSNLKQISLYPDYADVYHIFTHRYLVNPISNNNVLSVDYKFFENGQLSYEDLVEFTHTYDNDGFPTRSVQKDKYNGSFVTEYSYRTQGLVGEWHKLPPIVDDYPFAVRIKFYSDNTGTEERVMPCGYGYTLSYISFNWHTVENTVYFSNISDMSGCNTSVPGPADYSCTFSIEGDKMTMDDGNDVVWTWISDL